MKNIKILNNSLGIHTMEMVASTQQQSDRVILVVDDDAAIQFLVREVLVEAGYVVVQALTAADGWRQFQNEKPALVILDLHLPDGDGIGVCEKIRGSGARGATPIIMFTGEEAFKAKTKGFRAGADQYLTKPIAADELLLWVEALLRRVSFDRDEGDRVQVGELTIDVGAHTLHFRDQTIANLTRKEFDLLRFLVSKRPKVMSRDAILSELWGTVTVDHVVDTHISNLRKKLPMEIGDRIQNVPGRGFRYFET